MGSWSNEMDARASFTGASQRRGTLVGTSDSRWVVTKTTNNRHVKKTAKKKAASGAFSSGRLVLL